MNSTELTQLHDTFIRHSRTSRQHFAAAKLGRLMQFVRYDLSHWNHWNRPTRVRNWSSVQSETIPVRVCLCIGVTTLTLIPLSTSSPDDQNASSLPSSSTSSSSSLPSGSAAGSVVYQQQLALQSPHKPGLMAGVSERACFTYLLTYPHSVLLNSKIRVRHCYFIPCHVTASRMRIS